MQTSLISTLILMHVAVDLLLTPVFSGSMCVCCSQPRNDKQELSYTVVLVHKGVCVCVKLPLIVCSLFLVS